MENGTVEVAVRALRRSLDSKHTSGALAAMMSAQEEVRARFGPQFSAEHIPALQEAEFKSFLDFNNNKHWSGLHRQGSRICADMDALRRGLGVLLDESRPIAERVDFAVGTINGAGKGILTAILLVAFPAKYGVWNNTSEGGLKTLGLWPRFPRGTSLGAKYSVINDILSGLAADLGTDLWTLDALMWISDGAVAAADSEVAGEDMDTADPDLVPPSVFGLENHLQEFLWTNWDATELGREWARYTEEGDPNRGREFPCAVGRIDILAKHRTEPRWLVVELKRGQTSDATVGQVLRYMGSVKQELAEVGEVVEGLIIARTVDDKLRFALDMVPNVTVREYEVQFKLRPVRSVPK